jgi:hypothetical protein
VPKLMQVLFLSIAIYEKIQFLKKKIVSKQTIKLAGDIAV